MKKLMFTAAAMALVGVASAVETYTYKASVKHTYIKEKTVTKVLGNTLNNRTTVYVKYTKTTALDGYLIQDDGQLLRQSGLSTITGAPAIEWQPGNRCFLVVRNKGAEKGFKFARILPGIIEAKWYDDKLSAPGTSPAQGYLYIGGEVTAAYRGTTFNANDGVEVATYTPRQFTNWQRLVPAATTPLYGIDDYFFTSTYLFGQYNQPAWAGAAAVEEFGDTWMNHAGLGKAAYYNNIKLCCGRGNGGAGVVLDSLSGSLKVGIYLCSENGDDSAHSNPFGYFRTGILEDQLWIGTAANDNTLARWIPGVTYNVGVGPVAMQKLDMWADGSLDLGTTDVGTGTWSLKRTTTLNSVVLTDTEKNTIKSATAWNYATDYDGATGTTKPLIDAINGARVALRTDSSLFGNVLDGAMINYSFYTNYLR